MESELLPWGKSSGRDLDRYRPLNSKAPTRTLGNKDEGATQVKTHNDRYRELGRKGRKSVCVHLRAHAQVYVQVCVPGRERLASSVALNPRCTLETQRELLNAPEPRPHSQIL